MKVLVLILMIYGISWAGEVRLTTWSSVEMDPSWSPDRTKIAFDSNYTGNTDIWIMNADGSNKINITNNSTEDYNPCWSPDGAKIAFVSNRTETFQIWSCDPNGGNLIQITNLPYNNYWPSWSPDMTKIAHKTDIPFDLQADIYIYDLNNNTDTPLIQTSFLEQVPDWSSNGNIIAYSSYRYSLTDIYTKPAFGGSELLVTTQGPHDDCSPNWCFNDSKVLFNENVVNGQLWLVDSAGGTATQLTFTLGLKFCPNISSDNVMVAYCKDNYGNYDIYSCPFDELGQIGVVPTSLGNIKALYAGEQPAMNPPTNTVKAKTPRSWLSPYPH